MVCFHSFLVYIVIFIVDWLYKLNFTKTNNCFGDYITTLHLIKFLLYNKSNINCKLHNFQKRKQKVL